MRTSTCASSTRPSTAISRSPTATRVFEHGWNVDADVLVVCYGIVSRVAAPLRDEFALFRPIRIFPMLSAELASIAERYREVVVIEANDGQYADLVELAMHRPVKRVPLARRPDLAGGRARGDRPGAGGRAVGAADPGRAVGAPAARAWGWAVRALSVACK